MSWGTGMTQDDMMIKDECILLDFDDNIIGHGNKKISHTFEEKNPRGLLHRAFSVFLFNSEGKLLLQQRAASKITFPDVWTNTCCSHPLYGFDPCEVDTPADVANGSVMGVKNAAIRKLEHELGIPASSLKPSDFKFLTRLHYWAADVVTHGNQAPWGENEIDYILFIQKDVTCELNPEEASNVKYVSFDELKAMMKPETGLLWSPWFRIIAEQYLVHWWKDLKTTLTTDIYCDYKTIYRFDPTKEHMGGAGKAFEWLGQGKIKYSPKVIGDSSLKQGAYGKVIIHKHSKIGQIIRIDEVFSALQLKFGNNMVSKVDVSNKDVKFCNDMLGKVSRSFAEVIRQLPKKLCIDIMIFYLALRALDTIEDDMTAFSGRENEKIDHLCNFYRTGLVTDGWKMTGVGLGDEKVLLENYYQCVSVFKSLPISSQEVIADITRRMGEGMASYVKKDLGQGTVTIDDYNLYCHYVAGLVGEGLSRLFTSTGYESSEVAVVSKTLANTMGLFLQKTNIIRDYLEDFVDGRAFWPQAVWKKYAPTGDLGDFAKPENIQPALSCLNELITDALECVPECIKYMELLKTEEVFRFCAIPQVMAIATLSELYNNPKVFTGVVKIRKGLAAKMILDTKTPEGLHKWFYLKAKEILKLVPENDKSAAKTKEICNKIISLSQSKASVAVTAAYVNIASSWVTIGLTSSFGYLLSKIVNENSLARVDWVKLLKDNFSASVTFATSSLLLLGCNIYLSGLPLLKKAD